MGPHDAADYHSSTTYEKAIDRPILDSQALADRIDTVMFFVPSVDGISHNPREFTSDDDCVNGANVILNTVLGLAKG